MKNILLLLLSFLTVTQLSFSQSNTDFINFTSQWNLISGGQFSPNVSTRKLRFNSNPITYNNTIYYHMERSSIENSDTDWTLIEHEAFREEDEKVYLLNLTDTTEILIYDFTLSVGDTFTNYDPPSNSEMELTVVAVDSIQLLDGSFRKRIELMCGFSIVWVQGIGNLDYPLSHTTLSCYFDVPGSLICYSQNDDILYENLGNFGSCWIVDVAEIPSNEINIYPIPSKDKIYIEVETPIALAKLYNLNGQVLIEKSNTTELQLKNIQTGMYFLHVVNTNGQESTRKIIVE